AGRGTGAARSRPDRGLRCAGAASSVHRRFDVLDALRRIDGEDLAALVGDECVVLDADADVVERSGNVVGRAYVDAGLDGRHHSRAEDARGGLLVGAAGDRLAGRLVRRFCRRLTVVAAVVHVDAEPVPGAVHVEATVGAG